MSIRFTLLLCTVMFAAQAQYDPLLPPNTFASRENPNYWKNKKPHAAYWQQDVHYTIKATLHDEVDRIDGVMELMYTNNSPDQLSKLYFHLYQNAYEPGSYASLARHEIDSDSSDHYQHIEVNDLTVDGMDVRVEKDNTLLIVNLTSPLMPGEKARIECAFSTYFGPVHDRMKVYTSWGFKHYNVVHWYPRISVYDHKFGWTTDQHLGHEFYGDYGTYDVSITLPEEYILDGTGFLVNRSQVLPPNLMEQIRIERFKDKPWNEPPSAILSASDATKTWTFHAENVHDFAWTADPTYRIGEARVTLENGQEVVCYALAQEPHASRWQNAASYTAQIIALYSKDFGPYGYHKMIVADARDGMEYPMLTLDGGGDPGYRSLLAHEVGHNWFFGMLGNNETYRAALDEGFTQFLTAWAMVALEGDSVGMGKPLLGSKEHSYQISQRDVELMTGYYFSSIVRGSSPRLNTHSDHFEGRDYGQVYSKTGVMLYNLQYVLGDDLFLDAMKHYVQQWKFCHPYPEDFRASMIHFTGVDLNPFFDAWLDTEETVDYAIKRVRKQGENNYHITFQRKGISMPLDVRFMGEDGSYKDIYIPNSYFIKQTDAEVLPKWYGWGALNETYVAEVNFDGELKDVIIDPTKRLGDVYQLDNHQHVPVRLSFNNFKWEYPEHNYHLEWNPLIWYNGYDGLKLGVELNGDYWSTYHNLELKLWVNSGFLTQDGGLTEDEKSGYNRFNYAFTYSDPLRSIHDDLRYTWSSRWLEGLFANAIALQFHLPNNKSSLSWRLGGMYRPKASDLLYLSDGMEWNKDQWNNFNELSLDHRYRYNGRSTGHVHSTIRSPFLGSDYQYGYIHLEAVNENYLSIFNLRTRFVGQWGVGQNWAPESRMYAAGANPEQRMDQALTRSKGWVPADMDALGTQTGNYQVGGGLNLRGYNNYLMPALNADSALRFAYAGTTGLAFNAEIEFDDAVHVLSKYRRLVELKTYLFADAGILNGNAPDERLFFAPFRMDAGAGMVLDIKRWGRFADLNPLQIRLDFPLFLNRPPADQEYIAFRWLLGFQRAF
jgi:hypothetical protein